MRIYLAGGVSGNLKPFWKMVAHGMEWSEALASFLGRGRESALDSTPYG